MTAVHCYSLLVLRPYLHCLQCCVLWLLSKAGHTPVLINLQQQHKTHMTQFEPVNKKCIDLTQSNVLHTQLEPSMFPTALDTQTCCATVLMPIARFDADPCLATAVHASVPSAEPPPMHVLLVALASCRPPSLCVLLVHEGRAKQS